MTVRSHLEKYLSFVQAACARISPLWPLPSYVAVNPFLAYTKQPFFQAAIEIYGVYHAKLWQDEDFYRQCYQSGQINDRQLIEAAKYLDKNSGHAAVLTSHLHGFSQKELSLATAFEKLPKVLTLTETLGEVYGCHWHEEIILEISKWCAAYESKQTTLWPMPWQDLPLFEAWRQAIAIDLNLSFKGFKEIAEQLKQLPTDPGVCIAYILEDLKLADDFVVSFLQRQLVVVLGWSSYFQQKDGAWLHTPFNAKKSNMLDLLAIVLSYDYGIWLAYQKQQKDFTAARQCLEKQQQQWLQGVKDAKAFDWSKPIDINQGLGSLALLHLLQEGLEIAYQQQLVATLQQPQRSSKEPTGDEKVAIQAVFCIDVRSEVFRRHLENTTFLPLQTFGFAGFFGLPIAYRACGQEEARAQCPVLLKPQIIIEEHFKRDPQQKMTNVVYQQQQKKFWQVFKKSAASSFVYIESMGITFAWQLLKRFAHHLWPSFFTPFFALGRGASALGSPTVDELTLEQCIALAENSLKVMGLGNNIAPLILLCGHGAQSPNNPYAASLDCGACGGQAGDINARLAAAILNRQEVRDALLQKGKGIPSTSYFIAGLHCTTTDEVVLYDKEQLPASHQPLLEKFELALKEAGQRTRYERFLKLVGHLPEQKAHRLKKQQALAAKEIFYRSLDWSEVRSEWGLANNAAFIIAKRSMTRGCHLEGRVFLHSYDEALDEDLTILETLLTAPMVVAHWISQQYYASSVAPDVFGSGSKVLHNVVGNVGAIQGNGSSLCVGLPWQSVGVGQRLYHTPLRLQVFVQSTAEKLETIFKRHPDVAHLLLHDWIKVFTIDENALCQRLRFHL